MCSGTVRSVIVHDGFRGLYRGLGPTILGYLPTWAIYFSVYDFIKSSFGEAPLGISDQTASLKNDQIYPAAQVKGYQPVIREHPWSLHLLSAMTAGAVSTTATNPLWVIKTRFMVRHPLWPLLERLMPKCKDTIADRSSLSAHTRRGRDNISDRGDLGLLQRFISQSARNPACCSPVPPV